jgi:hypothetical protein
VRWRLVWAIAILAVVECLFWLLAGLVQWEFAGFSLGPVYSPQVAEGARASLTEFAWGALNIVVLVAYYLRGWGRWLMAAIQLANLVITIYLAFGAVIPSCGQDGGGLFWFAAIPAIALLLQYLLWRRIDRRSGSSSRLATLRAPATLALLLGGLAIGVVILVAGWRLTLNGIESHAGTVSSATAQTGGLSITIDSSPRAYFFSAYSYEPLPVLSVGDRVVILTGEACNYGTPLAVQSTRGIWTESIYGDAVSPYTPYTWNDHETLRRLLLSVGTIIELIALAGLALRIG